MPRSRVRPPWWRQPRRPLVTLPGVAAAPVILGPGFIIGGVSGLLADDGAGALLGDGLEVGAGLLVVLFVVTYALRPSSLQKAKGRG